ncbi:MAG TPA: RNA-binding S4 domain-containing protein [Paracoccaceae bacterium]
MAKYREGPDGKAASLQRPTLRIDKWLWQARFFRSRSLATEAVAEGHTRVNGVPVSKPAHAIGPGDTLTFPQGGRIRLIRVLHISVRRGPATEAQSLYLDLDGPDAAPSVLE